MEDAREKLPTIRKLIYIVAFIILFELTLLMVMIPSKHTFHWITLGITAISFAYLLVIALRLWHELRDMHKN